MSDLQFLEQEPEKTEDKELKEVSSLVARLNERRLQIALLVEQISNIKKEERALSEEEIPNFMKSRGLTSIVTTEGFKVTVKEDLKAYLPKNPIERNIALRWIAENGGAGIIKEKVQVDDPEQEVVEWLKYNSVPFQYLRDVNNRTMVAFMKSLLGISKGSLQTIEFGDIPPQLKPYVYNKTTIK